MFDFLKDVVSRVPDLGGSDAGAESATKRRLENSTYFDFFFLACDGFGAVNLYH